MKSGIDLVVQYDKSSLDFEFLGDVISRYGSMSHAALYALSHEENGAWCKVWNSKSDQFGMTIPNSLIVETFKGEVRGSLKRRAGGEAGSRYVN